MTKRAQKSPSEIGDLLCSRRQFTAYKPKWGNEPLICSHGEWYTSGNNQWRHPTYKTMLNPRHIGERLCDKDQHRASQSRWGEKRLICRHGKWIKHGSESWSHPDYYASGHREAYREDVQLRRCTKLGCNNAIDGSGTESRCVIHQIKRTVWDTRSTARVADRRDDILARSLEAERNHGAVVGIVQPLRKVNMRER